MPGDETHFSESKWLRRTTAAIDEALHDSHNFSRNRMASLISFDRSFLFPPLEIRKGMDILNPSDWLDISNKLVFDLLEVFPPEMTGYQFVLTYLTFMDIQTAYKMDLDLIDELSNISNEDEVFSVFQRKVPGFGPSNEPDLNESRVLDQFSTFLSSSEKQHVRLKKLHDYVKKGIIVPQGSIVPLDVLRNCKVRKDEFDTLFGLLGRRPNRGAGALYQSDAYTKGVEAGQILMNKHLTESYRDRTCVFLGWPSARSHYKTPYKYHRLITSILFKFASLASVQADGISSLSTEEIIRDADAHLTDVRDEYRFNMRRMSKIVQNNDKLTNALKQTIQDLLAKYIEILRGDVFAMDGAGKAGISTQLSTGRTEARKALVEAKRRSDSTRATLKDISSMLRADEVAWGWDPDASEQDNPIRDFLEGLPSRG